MQHDRDMAQCTQLIRSSLNPSPVPPSPTPIIWAPLVQAPLQAAAATTPLALALAQQTHLPPILFHHPIVSGSLKEPPGHPKKAYVGANSCGSGSGSPTCSSQVRAALETPTLASLRTHQLSAAPVSQPIFTSSLQPLGLQPLPPPQSLHAGVASLFPVGHTAVSYACVSQPSSQPFHAAMSAPPISVGLLQQGAPGRLVSGVPAPAASTISPLISSSVGPFLNHLQHTAHPSMQQWTSGGLNPPPFPLICSTLPSSACSQPVLPAAAGAAGSLAQHSLAGLRSAFLPQVVPEHSALASLAQYGSADASPSYTPPLHSPSLQSPARGRTVHQTELPGAVDSQSPAITTAPWPSGVSCPPTDRADTAGDIFSQEIKTISGSCTSAHRDRPLATSGSSEAKEGPSGAFLSSAGISEPYKPLPGQATPFSWTQSGPEMQTKAAQSLKAGHRESNQTDL